MKLIILTSEFGIACLSMNRCHSCYTEPYGYQDL
jgi:hypothetical protein